MKISNRRSVPEWAPARYVQYRTLSCTAPQTEFHGGMGQCVVTSNFLLFSYHTQYFLAIVVIDYSIRENLAYVHALLMPHNYHPAWEPSKSNQSAHNRWGPYSGFLGRVREARGILSCSWINKNAATVAWKFWTWATLIRYYTNGWIHLRNCIAPAILFSYPKFFDWTQRILRLQITNISFSNKAHTVLLLQM